MQEKSAIWTNPRPPYTFRLEKQNIKEMHIVCAVNSAYFQIEIVVQNIPNYKDQFGDDANQIAAVSTILQRKYTLLKAFNSQSAPKTVTVTCDGNGFASTLPPRSFVCIFMSMGAPGTHITYFKANIRRGSLIDPLPHGQAIDTKLEHCREFYCFFAKQVWVVKREFYCLMKQVQCIGDLKMGIKYK